MKCVDVYKITVLFLSLIDPSISTKRFHTLEKLQVAMGVSTISFNVTAVFVIQAYPTITMSVQK